MSREAFSLQTLVITNGFLFVSNRSNVSQLVTLDLDSKPTTILCQMGDFGCGDGGWTPVMKTDGTKVCLIGRMAEYSWQGFLVDDEARAQNIERISYKLLHILFAVLTNGNSAGIRAVRP